MCGVEIGESNGLDTPRGGVGDGEDEEGTFESFEDGEELGGVGCVYDHFLSYYF